MTLFAGYQYEIYLRGMAGERPGTRSRWDELERRAREAARRPSRAATCSAAPGTEDTMRENLEAFRRRRIVPRMLRDVAQRDLRTSCSAPRLPAPVLLAPVGVQSIVHPDGELASARAPRPRSGCRIVAEHGRVALARGDRRGDGRRAALVPALLAARTRS